MSEHGRLVQLVERAQPRRIARHGEEWLRAGRILEEAAEHLERLAGYESEVRGATGPSMGRAFRASAATLRERAADLLRGGDALAFVAEATERTQEHRRRIDRDHPEGDALQAVSREDGSRSAADGQEDALRHGIRVMKGIDPVDDGSRPGRPTTTIVVERPTTTCWWPTWWPPTERPEPPVDLTEDPDDVLPDPDDLPGVRAEGPTLYGQVASPSTSSATLGGPATTPTGFSGAGAGALGALGAGGLTAAAVRAARATPSAVPTPGSAPGAATAPGARPLGGAVGGSSGVLGGRGGAGGGTGRGTGAARTGAGGTGGRGGRRRSDRRTPGDRDLFDDGDDWLDDEQSGPDVLR